MGLNLKVIVQKLKLRYASEETVNATLREMGMRIGKGQSRRVRERQPKSVPARYEIHTRILATRFTNDVAGLCQAPP